MDDLAKVSVSAFLLIFLHCGYTYTLFSSNIHFVRSSYSTSAHFLKKIGSQRMEPERLTRVFCKQEDGANDMSGVPFNMRMSRMDDAGRCKLVGQPLPMFVDEVHYGGTTRACTYIVPF